MMPELRGKVTAGLGEGSYYVREYSDRIKEKLGFKPFFGTLNVSMDSSIHDMRNYIKYRVDRFEKDGTEFNAVEFIPAKILVGNRAESCYVLLPERSKHRHEIEILSEFNLREKLGLDGGEEIIIEIMGWGVGNKGR